MLVLRHVLQEFCDLGRLGRLPVEQAEVAANETVSNKCNLASSREVRSHRAGLPWLRANGGIPRTLKEHSRLTRVAAERAEDLLAKDNSQMIQDKREHDQTNKSINNKEEARDNRNAHTWLATTYHGRPHGEVRQSMTNENEEKDNDA